MPAARALSRAIVRTRVCVCVCVARVCWGGGETGILYVLQFSFVIVIQLILRIHISCICSSGLSFIALETGHEWKNHIV